MFKFISLNFWLGKRFEESLYFLKELRSQGVELIFLQEVKESDVFVLEERLGMKVVFASMQKNPLDLSHLNVGIAMAFPEGSLSNVRVVPYGTYHKHKPDVEKVEGERQATLLVARHVASGCTVATTQFTWTPRPKVDDEQRSNIKGLVEALKREAVDLLAGDFNSPRIMPNGSLPEIWSELAGFMKDNIPGDIITTMDPIHNASKEGDNLVVDGVFTSSRCKVQGVEVRSGVSDHCGIIGVFSSIAESGTFPQSGRDRVVTSAGL